MMLCRGKRENGLQMDTHWKQPGSYCHHNHCPTAARTHAGGRWGDSAGSTWCRVRTAFSTRAAEGAQHSGGDDEGTPVNADSNSSAAADALVTAPGLLLLVPLMLGLNGKVEPCPAPRCHFCQTHATVKLPAGTKECHSCHNCPSTRAGVRAMRHALRGGAARLFM